MRVVQFHRVVRRPDLPIFFQRHLPGIASQTVRTREGIGARVFASRRSAEEIAAHGYLVQGNDGYAAYPPDESALLDDSFVRGHCFQVEHEPRQHPREIGISFRPVADRGNVSDVHGTLWIDSVASALRVLEFSLTNLPASLASRGAVGGLLEFEDGPNGVPLLVEWSLRQPGAMNVASVERRGRATIGYVGPVDVEDGAQLARAEWGAGMSWVAPLSTIEGLVVDPDTHRPKAGVPIALLNAGRTVLTDSAGRFAFDELVDGPYRFAVDDTLTAMFYDLVKSDLPRILWSRRLPLPIERIASGDGASPLVRTFYAVRDSNPSITVELPSTEGAFRRACGKQLSGASAGVAAVWAIDSEGAVAGARISVEWQSGGVPTQRSVRSDDRGRAIVCGVPRDRSVRIITARDGKAGSVNEVVIGPERLVTLVVVRQPR